MFWSWALFWVSTAELSCKACSSECYIVLLSRRITKPPRLLHWCAMLLPPSMGWFDLSCRCSAKLSHNRESGDDGRNTTIAPQTDTRCNSTTERTQSMPSISLLHGTPPSWNCPRQTAANHDMARLNGFWCLIYLFMWFLMFLRASAKEACTRNKSENKRIYSRVLYSFSNRTEYCLVIGPCGAEVGIGRS